MTNTINFEEPQAKLGNGENGVQLSQVVLPYSIRNSADSSQYLGGQMTLTPEDGIKLTDNTKQWTALALTKIKAMVADTEEYVAPVQVEELPESSATEAPVSSADDSVASSASPASSVVSEATATPSESATSASVAPEDKVANSDSTQETTTPAESTEE